MENEYIRRADINNIFQQWREDLTRQIEDNIDFPHTRADLKVCRTQLDDCIHCVQEATPADVVEVVRCKDCRFYYKDKDGYEMCDNTECYDHVSADGFCAWAQRRTE